MSEIPEEDPLLRPEESLSGPGLDSHPNRRRFIGMITALAAKVVLGSGCEGERESGKDENKRVVGNERETQAQETGQGISEDPEIENSIARLVNGPDADSEFEESREMTQADREQMVFECVHDLELGKDGQSKGQIFTHKDRTERMFDIERSVKIVSGDSDFIVKTGTMQSGDSKKPCMIIIEKSYSNEIDRRNKKKTVICAFEVHGFGTQPIFARFQFGFNSGKRERKFRHKTFRRVEGGTDEYVEINPSNRKSRRLSHDRRVGIPDMVETDYSSIIEELEEACVELKQRKGLE